MKVDTEIRNAYYDVEGTISCEILHPAYGWIPFTANPLDVEDHGRAIYQYLESTGNVKALIDSA